MGLNVGLYLIESHVHSDKQNSLTQSSRMASNNLHMVTITRLEILLLTGLPFFDPTLASSSLNNLFTSRKIQNFPDYLRFS